jgi:general secretion pathway protein K
VDSILDWVDENNFHRLNGAENDYYGSLPEPYGAKNGPMDTVEELLWVKGVSAGLFYGEGRPGGPSRPGGMARAFTVYTGSKRVNVNTASFEILMSLPGMNTEGALRIIESREIAKFQGAGELARAGVTLAPEITRLLSFTSPGIYTIEATGMMPESPATRTIKAVVKIRRNAKPSILYWKDQAPDRSGLI